MPGLIRVLVTAFVIVVGFIAAVVLYGPKGAHDARYFPQPLTPFTLGALGTFYLSLSLATLALVLQRAMGTLSTWLRGTIVLLVIIVVATLVNIGLFHFGQHPRHIVYLATYLVVLVGTLWIMAWHRRAERALPAGAGFSSA
jgi:hypothetical protein